ncbi:MAG: hypothetical protein ABIW79_02405 [Gemmatimonas sp.]
MCRTFIDCSKVDDRIVSDQRRDDERIGTIGVPLFRATFPYASTNKVADRAS